eukprot:TCONS_00071363-protein
MMIQIQQNRMERLFGEMKLSPQEEALRAEPLIPFTEEDMFIYDVMEDPTGPPRSIIPSQMTNSIITPDALKLLYLCHEIQREYFVKLKTKKAASMWTFDSYMDVYCQELLSEINA